MKHFRLKSFGDLSEIKSLVASTLKTESSQNLKNELDVSLQRRDYKKLSENDRGNWAAIFDLLLDPFFSELAEGKINKISSKKYSTVVAALTYPTKADSIIVLSINWCDTPVESTKTMGVFSKKGLEDLINLNSMSKSAAIEYFSLNPPRSFIL